jgi:hypothetical protein
VKTTDHYDRARDRARGTDAGGRVVGTLLAVLALIAPALLGVATVSLDGRSPWFHQSTPGALLANAAILGVYVWSCTLTVRAWLGRFAGAQPPAWTWTAARLAVVAVVTATTTVTTVGGAIGAGLALRFTAYRADGSVRPEPLAVPSRRWALALGLALPVAAIGAATAYAIAHPVHGRWGSGGDDAPIAATRAPLRVRGPVLVNDGGRPVRILGVEPGVERGFALHLTDVLVEDQGVTPIGRPQRTSPLRPFTLAPHAERFDLLMVVSRAGCRPGTSGRIDSVRVRYELGGGVRSVLLALVRPLTLTC